MFHIDLLVKVTENLHVCVEGKIFRSESNSEVILGQQWLGRVEDVLVTDEPTLVTQNYCSIENGTSTVEGDVAFDMGFIVGVRGAKFSCLLPRRKSNDL